MKVVLLTNIKGIGRVGDIKDVNDGYARNYLIPRKLGKPATTHSLKESELIRTQKLQASQLAKAEAQQLLTKLSSVTISIPAKASAKGTLFSSISKDELAQRISIVAGARISASSIEADDQLKKIGLHTINVRLGEHLVAHIMLEITAAE